MKIFKKTSMKKVFKIAGIILLVASFLLSLVFLLLFTDIRMMITEKIGRLEDPCLEFISADLAHYARYKIKDDRVCYVPEYQEFRFYRKHSDPYAEYKTLLGADVKTFEQTGGRATGYAMDKNYFYHFGNKLPLQRKDIKFLDNSKDFVSDGKKVFAYGKEIEGADAATFNFIANSYFAKDKNTAYYGMEKLNDADVATFEVLNNLSYYAKDKSSVYFQNKKINNAQALTFGELLSNYGYDAKNIYYKGELIKDANRNNFIVLGGLSALAKDDKNVFVSGKKLLNADPATIEMLPYDSERFGRHMKDKNNVYYEDDILEGIDPKTFEIVNRFCIKDNAGWYTSFGERISYEECLKGE